MFLVRLEIVNRILNSYGPQLTTLSIREYIYPGNKLKKYIGTFTSLKQLDICSDSLWAIYNENNELSIKGLNKLSVKYTFAYDQAYFIPFKAQICSHINSISLDLLDSYSNG